MRRDRQQSARKLVRALGAAFEVRDAALDAEFDALVITGLEVHAWNVLDRSPITAPHRLAGVDVERRAYRLVIAVANDEQQMLRHGPRDLVEEIAAQIRRRVMRTIRAFVAAKEQPPIPFVDRSAALANERHAGVCELFPFLPDLFALFVREGG